MVLWFGKVRFGTTWRDLIPRMALHVHMHATSQLSGQM